MEPTIEPIFLDVDLSTEEYDLDASGSVEVTVVRPTITVTDIEGGHRVTVEDIGSTQSFDVMDGEDGEDGVSPVLTVSNITGGHRITIVDASGTSTVDVMDGAKGDKGDKGDTGDTGATGNGIASITQNNDYTLTITMTNGTTYTTGVIRGAKGDKGDTGATGNGIASVTLNNDYTLTITYTNGQSVTTGSIRGAQGPQGETGATGQTGATGNGIASVAKTGTSGLVDTYTITFTDGTTTTFTVTNGANGTGSVADVWVDGASVLDGDTAKIDLSGKADASDIPTKVSDLTNDSGFLTSETDPTVPSWAKQQNKPSYTASEVGAIPAPSSHTAGQFLGWNGSAWVAANAPSGGGSGLPTGGTEGQLLAMGSQDAEWQTASIELDEASAVGSAIVGTAVTDTPTFTEGGDVTLEDLALDYSYDSTNHKLIISGVSGRASFNGSGIKLKLDLEGNS